MSLLLRLYPRAWRERYGEELSALLEDRPTRPSDTIDLLLGAFDAHLHRRDVGIRPETGEQSASSRIGTAAAIAGGALWILTLVLGIRDDPALWDLTMILVGLSISMFVVALAAMSTAQSGSHQLLTWASFLLPAVGVALLVGGTVAHFVVGEGPAAGDLPPYAFWMGGVVLVIVGSVLLGVVSAATGALTRRTAALLSAGAMVQLVTILGTDHAREEWLLLVGAVVFGLSWILVGIAAARAEPMSFANPSTGGATP